MSAMPMIAKEETEAPEDELARARLFEGLPPVVVSTLRDSSERRRYDAGQTVFAMGQYDGEEFLVILSGLLQLNIVDAEKGEMMIEDFGPGAVFGLEAAFSEDEGIEGVCRRVAATAVEDVDVVAIEIEPFRKLAASRPSLMRNVAFCLARDAAALRYRRSPAQTPPEQRIFAALMDFVERAPASGEWRIEKMPKHRELAEKAGVEETEAASAVAALIQDGVARRDYPALIINDIRRLNSLAGLG